MKIEDKVKVNSKHITVLLEHVTDLLDRVRVLEELIKQKED